MTLQDDDGAGGAEPSDVTPYANHNDTYSMRGIPAPVCDALWHYAEPYVKRALDHASGELTPADLRRLCANRAAQLWLIAQGNRVVGAATTEIVVYPNRKHCRVITLAGSAFAEWVSLADEMISAWALGQGCDALEAYVRRGLANKMTALGYKPKHVVMLKDILHE